MPLSCPRSGLWNSAISVGSFMGWRAECDRDCGDDWRLGLGAAGNASAGCRIGSARRVESGQHVPRGRWAGAWAAFLALGAVMTRILVRPPQRLNGSTAQRLNGSTAQRLNGSTAQRLNGSTAR
jgi:hypothetical protein